MNEEMLAKAKAKVKDVRLFINGVSKRADQLVRGSTALVPVAPNSEESKLDIALREVAEGKIIICQGDDSK